MLLIPDPAYDPSFLEAAMGRLGIPGSLRSVLLIEAAAASGSLPQGEENPKAAATKTFQEA